ncbi:MAG: ATP-binding protein [Candidatus Sericytochromatia bacterium]|nr:ATP-binding protein [Candidatus Sericytochromatia bacterium]
MTRLLKSVYFLNSASMLYAQVNLNGNIHVTGKNGSGKTSILRAILFFYNPDTQNLGIGSNQKTFIDFYFPEINSYIIYQVEKETFTYLIIAFKKQNRVCFRIVESDFKKENFIRENQIMTIQDVLAIFHSERKPVFNKIIDTYKDFKSLIYGFDNDFKRYSIFDNKGNNYQSIPRTISNIFLNYKLDSNFIKNSIINSIMEETPTINLNSLKNQLGKFYKQFNDIKTFNLHLRSANNITDIYTKLIEMDSKKKELASMLGYKVNNASLERIQLTPVIKGLDSQIKFLDEEITNSTNKFNKLAQELNFNIKMLENNLKNAENKTIHYQNINIEKIIKEFENKEFIQKELEILNKELSLLKNNNISIHEKYEMLKREIIQSVKEKENDFERNKNLLSGQLIKEKEEIKVNIDNLKKDTEIKYELLFEKINENINYMNQELMELNNQYNKVNYSEPLNEKIKDIVQKLENYKQSINMKNFDLQNIENDLKLIKRELKNSSDQQDYKTEQLQEKQDIQIKVLNTNLIKLSEKLKFSDSSFSYFLEKNYPEYKENIAKVVSEEILFSSDLSPIIKEKNNLLFGVDIDLSILPKAKTLEDYKIQKDELEQEISDFNQENIKSLAQIKEKYQEDINILERKVIEHEKKLAKVKKEISDLKTILELASIQLSQTKSESNKIKNQGLEKINLDILKQKSNLNLINQEGLNLKIELNDEINSFEKEQNLKFIRLQDKHDQALNEDIHTFNDFKESNRKKLTEIKNEYHKELDIKGINEPKIKELEKNKANLSSSLKFIDENSQQYYNYQSDKSNLLDKVEQFNEEINKITREKDGNNKDFQKQKAVIISNQIDKKSKLNEKTNLLRQLDTDLEHFELFSSNFLFKELSDYILNEKYFIQSEYKVANIINDLNNLKNQLLERNNALKNKITRYSDNFDDDNIFSFNKNNDAESDFINFAKNLNSFIEEDKILEYKKLISTSYSMIILDLSRQINELTSKESEIQKTITRINGSFEKTRFIDVIKDIELRLKTSNNNIIFYLRKIREFTEQNPFAGEFNLFNQDMNKESEDKAIELLRKLKQSIEESKSDKISLEESFEIEFRIKENNNDTGFIEKLSSVGSNGTDVLIKAMIYITLLDIAKSRLKLKDFKIHCIVDEVGILDNSYLKYLVQFANEKDILLINGSPNPAEAFLYNYIYRVKKDSQSNSIVKPLIEARINEIKPWLS